MVVKQSQREATDRYLAKLDDIRIRVPKGMKAEIKNRANEIGLSINAYIVKLINDDMKKADD